MQNTKRILILLVVLISCVGCDQATKLLAQQNFAGAPAKEYANGLFRFVYAENPGAFLSLGATLPHEARFWLFVVIAALLLLAVGVIAFQFSSRIPTILVIALALILGGGSSNLIDRLLNDGRVIDFMQIGHPRLHTGIFNVADMAIMTGVVLMMLAMKQRTTANS
jgi:signal peptidase II